MLRTQTRHSIRKQTLQIIADDEDQLMRLHAHCADINRRHLLPAIERVLAQQDIPGLHIVLDKLSIDLGSFAPNDFEQQLGARLESALGQVLEKAIKETAASSEKAHVQHRLVSPGYCSEADNQLGLLSYYLSYGTVPWYLHDRAGFSCETLLTELAKQQRDGLITLIRQLGKGARVIQRLVTQLSEKALCQLLELLEPNHGALIIAYLMDIKSSHLRQAVLAINGKTFNHLLWVLVLSYSTGERGSQFNRQSYVKSLLQSMAQNEGIDYQRILDALDLGLQQLVKIRPLQSSLPAVIAKLVNEQQRICRPDHAAQPTQTPAQQQQTLIIAVLAQLEQTLKTGLTATNNPAESLDWTQVQALVSGPGAGDTLQLVRRLAKQARPGLSRLIESLLKVFTGTQLLALLAGKEQRLLDTWVNLLTGQCSAGAQPELVGKGPVWQAVFDFLLKQAVTPWQVAAMVQQTLTTVAGHIGSAAHVLAAQLLVLLDAQPNGAVKQALTAALTPIAGQSGIVDDMVTRIDGLYDKIEQLKYYLCHGVFHWRAVISDSQLSAKSTMAFLLQLTQSQLRDTLHGQFLRQTQPHQTRSQRDALFSIVRHLPSAALISLLKLLLPKHQVAGGHLLGAVSEFVSKTRHKDHFYVQLLLALLHKQQVDLEQIAADAQQKKPRVIEQDGQSKGQTAEPQRWSSELLQSVIVSGLRQQHSSGGLDEQAHPSEHHSTDIGGCLDILIGQHSDIVRPFVGQLYQNSALVSSLFDQVTEPQFCQLLQVLQPVDSECLLAFMDVLVSVPVAYRPNLNKLRSVILEQALYLEHPIGEGFFTRVLQQLFPHSLSSPLKLHLSTAADKWSSAPRLPQVTTDGFKAAIGKTLTLTHAQRQAQSKAQGNDNRKSIRPKQNAEVPLFAQPLQNILYIDNAGLILAAVFLPHLFRTLDMLGSDDKGKTCFKDSQTFGRAVHLLQYLVDGSTHTAEPVLVLNKILCGGEPTAVVPPGIEITEQETTICQQLLNAMKQRWGSIDNTSVEGLQQTFLQREGRLRQTDDGWSLTVQRKTLDVLVDQVPWRTSIISEAWMPKRIHVTW